MSHPKPLRPTDSVQAAPQVWKEKNQWSKGTAEDGGEERDQGGNEGVQDKEGQAIRGVDSRSWGWNKDIGHWPDCIVI